MTLSTRAWLLAAAASIAGAAPAQTGPAGNPPAPALAAPSVQAGVEAWQAGRHEDAIRNWRPLADRGDPDAQYNLAQAYFLGRGVPQNTNLAEQWYERAARQGHEEAQGNFGLLLFQNNRRAEAMPWIERAAGRGDPRAQYVLGTALFNGDLIGRDAARAYALMTRAAAQGLPPARTQLTEMEAHISAEDRARGTELARALAAAEPNVRIAGATPPRVPVVTPNRPAPRPTPTATSAPPPRTAPRPTPPAPTAIATAGGRWRVQLGAFGSEANARRAWAALSGRLPGLQPQVVRAGAVFRLQAGPLANRAAADRACAAVRQACFPVAP